MEFTVCCTVISQKVDIAPKPILYMVLNQPSTETFQSNLLSAILENESSDLLSIGFDETLVDALIEVLGQRDDPPNVQLLTTDPVLKWVRDDFVLASEADHRKWDTLDTSERQSIRGSISHHRRIRCLTRYRR